MNASHPPGYETQTVAALHLQPISGQNVQKFGRPLPPRAVATEALQGEGSPHHSEGAVTGQELGRVRLFECAKCDGK
jgi:hypothetical protein